MSLWLLLTLALLVQEGLSVTVLLLRAYQEHYSLILIHVIWLAVTVLQIYAGFYLGKWIQKRFANSKFERWLRKSSEGLEKHIGKSGEALALIFVSGVISPFIAALGAAWLDISFFRVLMFALVGDFFWYVSEWGTVFGASHLFTNPVIALVVIAVAGLALSLMFGLVRRVH